MLPRLKSSQAETARVEFRDKLVMHDVKSALKKVFNLPLWLIILLTVLSTVSLITVFCGIIDYGFFAYISYFLSAYTLTVVCIFCANVLPGYIRNLKKQFSEHPYGNKYLTDVGYKVRVSLYISLTVNLAYSVFKLISGVVYSSFWWGAIAVYYIILSVIRFFILRYMRSNNQDIRKEWKQYRVCGILMVLLNLSLSGIVFQMVWQNRCYSYPEILVIASAAYTFYTVTVSVIDMVKYRKYNSPVMSAAKTIRFAAALVALLNLETAMLSAFGSEDAVFTRIMTACTGAAVCIAVLAMSVFMIVKSFKSLKTCSD